MTTAPSPLLVIVGPTASGKSRVAFRVAQQLGGELVSADAMQVYRGFDIGTAKPTAPERAEVPHHLIDVVDPADTFSAARFVQLADAAIAAISQQGKRPIVVGGTGLYIRALLRGLFAAPPKDDTIRRRHRELKESAGTSALFAELRQVDPESASRLDPNDFVRISRALEVHELTGEKISVLQEQHRFATVRYNAQLIGLDPGPQLREQIERRIDQMIGAGWVAEVEALIAAGHGQSHPMGALGYRHLAEYLRGTLDLPEAIRQTKRDTWHFARRQRNWFRADPAVRWFAEPDAVLL